MKTKSIYFLIFCALVVISLFVLHRPQRRGLRRSLRGVRMGGQYLVVSSAGLLVPTRV